MAKLTLKIDASNSGEATVADAKLISQVDLAVAAWNGPATGTQSEKLAFVAGKLKGYLIEVAKGEKRRQRQDTLEAQLAQDGADLSD